MPCMHEAYEIDFHSLVKNLFKRPSDIWYVSIDQITYIMTNDPLLDISPFYETTSILLYYHFAR